MKPYYEDAKHGLTIYCGDCEEIIPQLFPVDVVCTSPPFGNGVAEWDGQFPTTWLEALPSKVRKCVAINCGANNILNCPKQIGYLKYRWTLAPMIRAGSTVGLMGFAAWLPWLCYARDGVSLYGEWQDAEPLNPARERLDHPSPLPVGLMKWVLNRLPTGEVLDPFMGSGSTLVACKQLRRQAIGIEREERFCELAARRMEHCAILPLADLAIDTQQTLL